MAEDTYTALVDAQTKLTEADRLLGVGHRQEAYANFLMASSALFNTSKFSYCRDAGLLANRLGSDVIGKLVISLLDGGALCWQPQRDRIKARSAALVVDLGRLVEQYAPPE